MMKGVVLSAATHTIHQIRHEWGDLITQCREPALYVTAQLLNESYTSPLTNIFMLETTAHNWQLCVYTHVLSNKVM